MKKIIPIAETTANIHPGKPIERNACQLRRPSNAKITKATAIAPKMPRHANIVQLSKGISRVKNPAVLQATAEPVTNTNPSRYPTALIDLPLIEQRHYRSAADIILSGNNGFLNWISRFQDEDVSHIELLFPFTGNKEFLIEKRFTTFPAAPCLWGV
ncbi:hypothetical protein FHW16_002031 [Phyllobacterium myrsinacearum]|uniref:Uncharacterized protein n=1 Tax=Phyllobacterium myrsinacearum TaxID=28101 RepID=A0A839EHQ4_9HYPH|nr:hypothetical protein [Phyllobacterium myrsinacearum]MBA8878319.1 hypothetical protein [Phyllobacterium myrsinacearum]